MSKPIANHTELENLLSDTGPESALRWIKSVAVSAPNTHLTPAIFRALISYTLRSAKDDEADIAITALNRAAELPVQCPGAPLGFTIETPDDKRALILQEILHALAVDEPLPQDGPVLSFYSNAGHGSANHTKFMSVNLGADGRPKHGIINDSIERVRRHALIEVVKYITTLLLVRDKLGNLIAYCLAGSADVTFLGPFVNDLPRNVDRLEPRATEALHKFYSLAFSSAKPHVREGVVSSLVNSIMYLASDRPANVGRFFTGLQEPSILVETCRLCLRQRYGVTGTDGQPLSFKLISENYLTSNFPPRKINCILPALFTGLIRGWMLSDSFSTERPSVDDATICCDRANATLAHLGSTAHLSPAEDRFFMRSIFLDFMQCLTCHVS